MKSLRIEDAAEAEFAAAVAYYESKRPGLGLLFTTRLEEAFRRIGTTPARYPLYKKSTCRKYVVADFPYLIFFKELPTQITIIAVAHARRRPGYWRTRVPQG